MKRLMLVATATLIMSACSNSEKSEEIEKNQSVDLKTEEKSETKAPQPSAEEQKTESVAKKEIQKKSLSVEQSDSYSYITKDGKVDILSQDFINDYFYHNHISEFGGIKTGMPIHEVEKLYGPSSGSGRAAQYPTTGKFGDIALDYPDGYVQNIFINPSVKVTKSQVEQAYGTPTKTEASAPLATVHDIYIYDSNKNNGFKILMLFENNQVVLLHQLPESDHQVQGTSSKSFSEDEKMAMTKAFYDWAGERGEIGNMAVTDEWFGHGAAGRGDWYAATPDGEVQVQNNDNPGPDGFKLHAIGGVVFYQSVEGSVGKKRTNGITAEGYSKAAVPGKQLHKYMLVDNGVVYEYISDQMSYSTPFGEYNEEGVRGDYTPGAAFEISGDHAAQAKWKEILAQYS